MPICWTRRLLPVGVLALTLVACAERPGESDGWRPFRLGGSNMSVGVDRAPAGFGGSRMTVPRVTGGAVTIAPLQEEDGDIWPARQPPRIPMTDPEAVGRPAAPGAGRRQPQGGPVELYDPNPFDPAPLRPPAAATPAVPPAAVPGTNVIPRPGGPPAIGGAGTTGARTFTVPGRAGVGTAFPDGRGGSILVDPDGSVTVAPR